MTCRLSNNVGVHVLGEASMIGTYRMLRLEECRGFYYFGHIVDEA